MKNTPMTKAPARAAASQEATRASTLTRRIFALESARAFWSARARASSVTLDLSLAARIDAVLADYWDAGRKRAMAAVGYAARRVKNENSLAPAARFLIEHGSGQHATQHKAACAALDYALRHEREETHLIATAQAALAFLAGRKSCAASDNPAQPHTQPLAQPLAHPASAPECSIPIPKELSPS
jgi:hypothetical protein